LQHAGGESQFTFENGAADLVEEGLEGMDVPFSEEPDASGLTTIVALPEGRPPMFFAERVEVGQQAEPEPPTKRRRIITSAKPAKPARPKRAKSLPKGEVFDAEGGVTKQGLTQVRKMRRYRNADLNQANLAVSSDPQALENLTREHFRRKVNRDELSGKVISGGNIRTYAEKLAIQNPTGALDLDQATVEFLEMPENKSLKDVLLQRLKNLREALGMPESELPDDQIEADPWTAAAELQRKAIVSVQENQLLRRAADDFVYMFSRSIGDLKPDALLWDPDNLSLTVIDPTHTVNTSFDVFHEFKTMLYARIFEMMTGLPVEGIEFRSEREQRTLRTPK
jgi:hypothetical protein